jgi:hypothetical protein
VFRAMANAAASGSTISTAATSASSSMLFLVSDGDSGSSDP